MDIVLQNLILAIAGILDSLLSLYSLVLIVAVLISWVNPDPGNPVVRFLRGVTDPVLYQVRRRLPFVYASGIDFSPIVVFMAIYLIRMVVVDSLRQLAIQMPSLAAWVLPHVG